jgi:flagellar basal-body rod protein FlgB
VIDRLEQELHFSRTALNLRGFRQELLASNIANADTPHFKARDVDFKSALDGALSGKGDGGFSMSRTSARHLPGNDENVWNAQVRYRTEYQGAVDGNTVNMDIERSAFAENAVQVETLLTLVSGKFRTLSHAIQGQ